MRAHRVVEAAPALDEHNRLVSVAEPFLIPAFVAKAASCHDLPGAMGAVSMVGVAKPARGRQRHELRSVVGAKVPARTRELRNELGRAAGAYPASGIQPG